MSDSQERSTAGPTRLGGGAVAVVAAGIVVLAAALRFHHLGARPIHFDEGVHAYYAWRFATEGEFVYEPWRHGPLLYYATAPPMRLIDDSVVVGRAVVAAVSLAMLPALYLLRRDFPRSTLLFAASVLAIHPYALRTARLYRNDALLATFCLLGIGLYAAYRRRPRVRWPPAWGRLRD